MASNTQAAQAEQTLEAMIDAHGLEWVLFGLGVLCNDKADHIRASYSDNTLARSWERCGKACFTAAKADSVVNTSPTRH